MALSQWELILRLLLAAGLGSVIGLERERLVWAAGLRTHMLVCVGSCLMIVVSAYGFNPVLGSHIVLDPSRVAAQVVSGIGFLGAGSIILRNEAVKGLTTAASIWAVAGIGLAAGAGLYTAAVASTLIILGILAGLKPIGERFRATRTALELHLLGRHGELTVALLEKALAGRAARIKRLIIQGSDMEGQDLVKMTLTHASLRDSAEIVSALEALPAISTVRKVRA
jgi:putative Mg2+ transporter-C (MgtC) family protein